MNILIVDDERIARDGVCDLIKSIYPQAEIHTFERSDEAIESAGHTQYDIAFCDIMMEPISGIETAKKLSRMYSKTNIIFTTGFSNFTSEAMELHASGYIVKPVTKNKLLHELEFLRYPIEESDNSPKLEAHCFGNFDFFADGQSINFAYSKSKELLAYLIDRQGTVCSNNEISSVLGDEEGESLGYSYLNGIRRDLVATFKKLGYEDVVIRQRGGLRIDPKKIKCDYYDLLSGNEAAITAYSGEYMSQYSWAELTNGELWRKYK